MKVPCIFIAVIITVTANVSHYTDYWEGKDYVDWREYRTSSGDPVVSEPIDQLGCGGCYGFAITGVIETHAAIALDRKLVPLSPQYFVDCFNGNGCDGGDLGGNLKFIEQSQYIPYNDDFEYKGYYDKNRCEEAGIRNQTQIKNVDTNVPLKPNVRNGMAGYYVVVHNKISGFISSLEAAVKRGPTINGMYISKKSFQWKKNIAASDEGVIDSDCSIDSNSHAWSFVGYTSKHFIIKNSYGTDWGDHGFVNYNKANNTDCNYGYQAFSIVVIKRRDIEYMVGKGKLDFVSANANCKSLDATTGRTGWTLAVIPTEMHHIQVYNMVTDKWGDEKKQDEEYNFVWIGINTAKDKMNMKFVDGSEAFFKPFKPTHDITTNYVKMSKFRGSDGKWLSDFKNKELRFVCSRYRSEECPKKYWPDIGLNAASITYSSEEIVSGTVMKVACVDGYEATGTAECRNGKWSHDIECVLPATTPFSIVTTTTTAASARCEEFDTSDLNIKDSDIEYDTTALDGKYPSGTSVKVSVIKCLKKHKKKSKVMTSKCENGEWSPVDTKPCQKKKKKRKVAIV